MNSLAQWIRVAEGLRLVVTAVVSQTSNRSSTALTSMAKHGSEVVANSRKAVAAAATTTFSSPVPHINTTTPSTTEEHANRTEHHLSYLHLQSVSNQPPSTVVTSTLQSQQQAINYTSTILENMEAISDQDKEKIQDQKNPTDEGSSETETKISLTDRQPTTIQEPTEGISIDTNVGSSSSPTITLLQEQPIGMPSTRSNWQVATTTTVVESLKYHDSKNPHLPSEEPATSNLPDIQFGGAVPSTQLSRAMSFATLGLGLAMGTMVEATKRLFVTSDPSSTTNNNSSVVASDANAQRFASTLARLRGAALKLGQMLSIQEDTILSPPLAKALREVVHQGANAMPQEQLYHQLSAQLGDPDWKNKYFRSFEDHPIAAASIGQVHRATLKDGRQVVVKVQYPGVAESIESDLANLNILVKATGLAPPGLFIDEIIRVGRKEVLQECDYEREMANQKKFRKLVDADSYLSTQFQVPYVIGELTTKRILTTEFVPGGSIEKVANLSQVERNRIGRAVMALTIKELFEWRFMQTDPK